MDEFPIEVQIRTPFPVPVDRMDQLQKLVDAAKHAQGFDAQRAVAILRQEGDNLVISYQFTVEPEYDDD